MQKSGIEKTTAQRPKTSPRTATAHTPSHSQSQTYFFSEHSTDGSAHIHTPVRILNAFPFYHQTMKKFTTRRKPKWPTKCKTNQTQSIRNFPQNRNFPQYTQKKRNFPQKNIIAQLSETKLFNEICVLQRWSAN